MDFRLERGFTLEDALNMVYEDDIDVREIFIEPPDSNVLTDEDSGEEDEGGTIDKLNRQQLSAHVEVRIHNGKDNNQIEAAASTTQNIAERPGKNPKGQSTFEKEFGINILPMISMIHEFPEPMRKLPFKFYFDNLFTGFNVLYYLKQNGYDDSQKQSHRGDYCSIIDEDDGVIVVKWVDNNVVDAASTCHGTNSTTSVKRFSRVEKKMIYVSRPSLITEYNRFMGGTDLLDENTARYRISIRRKKWWWAIFTWLLDVSVVNAWNIYRQHENIKKLVFRRQIVQKYLTKYAVPPKGAGKPATSRSSVSLNRVSDDLRYDGRNHFLVPNEGRKRRCAGEECSSSVLTKCRKCDVGLCIECNEIFHTKLFYMSHYASVT
ncbi:hypothetical protein JTB14_001883 [Gonioctena quinquepunctata]|nr:hypothetical protein JTB14_001883 [Gonioctena quinquepunctata]